MAISKNYKNTNRKRINEQLMFTANKVDKDWSYEPPQKEVVYSQMEVIVSTSTKYGVLVKKEVVFNSGAGG